MMSSQPPQRIVPGRLVYLDNAATSWPKPPAVMATMSRLLGEAGANPGRSGHRLSVEAARAVFSAREAVAGLLGVPEEVSNMYAITESMLRASKVVSL